MVAHTHSKNAKQKRSPRKWNPELVIDIFLLARSGLSDEKIALALNVNDNTFFEWKRDKPEVKAAITRGKSPQGENDNGGTFQEYVYKQLRPELKEIWDEIVEWSDHDDSWERINAVLYDKPTKVRQQLFVHAMCHTVFDVSESCRLVGIGRRELESWASTDSEFTALMQDLDFHKKNYFETALISLTTMRNPHAVMFVNKTKNRDRGYGEVFAMEHKGKVEHAHAHTHQLKAETLNFEELMDHGLELDDVVKVRDAMRRRNEHKAAEAAKLAEAVPPALG
jgi:hypothetical protein